MTQTILNVTTKNKILNYLGYILGCPIITYRLIVIANTVNNDTAKRPYLRNGNKRHNNSP